MLNTSTATPKGVPESRAATLSDSKLTITPSGTLDAWAALDAASSSLKEPPTTLSKMSLNSIFPDFKSTTSLNVTPKTEGAVSTAAIVLLYS